MYSTQRSHQRRNSTTRNNEAWLVELCILATQRRDRQKAIQVVFALQRLCCLILTMIYVTKFKLSTHLRARSTIRLRVAPGLVALSRDIRRTMLHCEEAHLLS